MIRTNSVTSILFVMVVSILLSVIALNSFSNPKQQKKRELSEYVKQTKGLEITEANNTSYIRITEEFEISNLAELLSVLKENKTEFEFYDPLLYPKADDPGAYITYSREKVTSDSLWSMTFGNHGWSGGIYHISDSTVLFQLTDLIHRKLLKEIRISNVVFFSHYDLKGDEASKAEDKMIRDFHAND